MEDICRALAEHANDEDTSQLELAHLEEWTVLGCSACPRAKTILQREKYFSKVDFLDLKGLLAAAEKTDFI